MTRTPSDRAAHNMCYLRLTREQVTEHARLMAMKMSDWPPRLASFVDGARAGCGDGIACAVADWIREEPMKHRTYRHWPSRILGLVFLLAVSAAVAWLVWGW